MTITIDKDGKTTWYFYRKAYRKARWRREGQRLLNTMRKYYPGCQGLIIVI